MVKNDNLLTMNQISILHFVECLFCYIFVPNFYGIYMRKIILWVAWGMLILGATISLCFIYNVHLDGYQVCGESNINYEVTGQFGDYLGGVVGTLFTFAGTLLMVLTFKEQSKQNKIESFETKFYEMLHLHKENVNEIQVNDKKGRKAIEFLFYQLRDIYKIVEAAANEIENVPLPMHDPEETERFSKMKRYLSDPTYKLKLLHDLSYGYFFYGVQNYYLTKDKQDIRFDIKVDITAILVANRTSKDLFASPHNSVLGHYFRHLYQTIRYIADDKDLKENQKYNYAKMVRAQLSDFEQALLYYNSLSIMGNSWIRSIDKRKIEKMCLIARFRLIKNIPYYFEYFGIHPGDFFSIEKEVWEQHNKDFFELDLPN